jgi:serine/threonine-protein kinase
VGRRLPTEAEWEYAARGTTLFRFPWGDADAGPSLANYDYQLRDTAAVGSYPDGASPFGVLDLGGNVWEYTADYYLQTYYRNSPEANPTGPEKPGPNGQQRVVRGGSWADSAKEMRVANRGFMLAPDLSADKLSQSYLGEANNRTGFRCVSDK